MDRYVHSALSPRDRDRLPPGPLLGRALDYVAREEWRSARAVLDRAVEDPAERRRAQYLLWEVCQVLGEPGPAVRALRAALRAGPRHLPLQPRPAPPHPGAGRAGRFPGEPAARRPAGCAPRSSSTPSG